MPATYWLPLPGMNGPARVEHVHAAFSRWFDGDPDDDHHHDEVKPYRLAPMSQREGRWGVEVSLLNEQAFRALEARVIAGASVRLGGTRTAIGAPVVLGGESWFDLAQWRGERGWRVDFLTPFTSRTGSRCSPLPSVPAVLRAPSMAWNTYSGYPILDLTAEEHRAIWVSDVNLTTTQYTIQGHAQLGALGSMTCRTASDEVASQVAALFRLAAYSGVGSFRGKGMGVVAVQPFAPARLSGKRRMSA